MFSRLAFCFQLICRRSSYSAFNISGLSPKAIQEEDFPLLWEIKFLKNSVQGIL
jgi:hypothetical protein